MSDARNQPFHPWGTPRLQSTRSKGPTGPRMLPGVNRTREAGEVNPWTRADPRHGPARGRRPRLDLRPPLAGRSSRITRDGGFNSPAMRVRFTRRYGRRSLRDQRTPARRARRAHECCQGWHEPVNECSSLPSEANRLATHPSLICACRPRGSACRARGRSRRPAAPCSRDWCSGSSPLPAVCRACRPPRSAIRAGACPAR